MYVCVCYVCEEVCVRISVSWVIYIHNIYIYIYIYHMFKQQSDSQRMVTWTRARAHVSFVNLHTHTHNSTHSNLTCIHKYIHTYTHNIFTYTHTYALWAQGIVIFVTVLEHDIFKLSGADLLETVDISAVQVRLPISGAVLRFMLHVRQASCFMWNMPFVLCAQLTACVHT
jgi:hypothetical protein